jgi:hypothetical protein
MKKVTAETLEEVCAMGFDEKFDFKKLTSAVIIMVVFWAIAVVLWQTTGDIFYLFNFVYLGTAIGVGIGLYMALPRRQKHWGRRVSQLFMGGYLLVFLGLLKWENMQIEGFFFYLMSGFLGGSLVHYLVAKTGGPLLFNRGWCGWSCWTAMVLDFLPYKRNKRGRLDRKWGYLRYVHFALSLGVVALWFGLGYRVPSASMYVLFLRCSRFPAGSRCSKSPATRTSATSVVRAPKSALWISASPTIPRTGSESSRPSVFSA